MQNIAYEQYHTVYLKQNFNLNFDLNWNLDFLESIKKIWYQSEIETCIYLCTL